MSVLWTEIFSVVHARSSLSCRIDCGKIPLAFGRSGGMADAVDSKSTGITPMRVRLPPSAPAYARAFRGAGFQILSGRFGHDLVTPPQWAKKAPAGVGNPWGRGKGDGFFQPSFFYPCNSAAMLSAMSFCRSGRTWA